MEYSRNMNDGRFDLDELDDVDPFEIDEYRDDA